MADENLELTPGSPNGGDDGGEDPHGGGTAEPTQEEIDALPEWAKEKVGRVNNVETIISDLKKTAGVKSVKDLKEKLAPKAPEKKPETATPGAPKNDAGDYFTREEALLMRQGYEPDELDLAKKLKPGVSLSDALQDATVKAAINGVRTNRKSEAVTPEPSDRTPIVNGKPFAQLTPAEQKANYSQTMKKLVDKARNGGNRNHGR